MNTFRALACTLSLVFSLGAALVPSGRAAAAAPDPAVRLVTGMGDIVVRLDARKAPISTANFVQYVKAGFYDGTVFHRVIKNFMIQGGGLTADLKEQKGGRAPIRNEANNGLKNRKYTIAMARTNEPHSATSQFFINVKDNDFLDFRSQTPQGWGYAVFGKVIQGQDVVDKIAAVTTGKKGYYEDVPVETVVIKKAEMVE
ncbi:MAG: peptidyl-prolyl cis-trans isomerase [Desulfovibrio desulfuricans]|jgi:peptidyl-prolyl cis-trans isomerase B (cyclophilin B)|nr:peptidyl-prolyl cis-trans isomerase [Desulfovibrio desulfuricans]